MPSMAIGLLLALHGYGLSPGPAVRVWRPREARVIVMAPSPPAFATLEALEDELRAYLAALPAAELEDESLPPPLAYSELSRNGRDDLSRAVLEFGGYIQLSRRLGLRWLLPKKEGRAPTIEVDNFDPTKTLRTGFLKLGNARRATEDVLETKRLDEIPRRQPAPPTAQAAGRSKLASLLQPARVPYVNTEDELPLRQLLVDMQMSVPQRAGALLLAWALALAFGPHPAVQLEGDALLAARGAASGLAAAHGTLGAYAAVLASGQRRNPLVWWLKGTLGGVPALSELRAEDTRLAPPAGGGEASAAGGRP